MKINISSKLIEANYFCKEKGHSPKKPLSKDPNHKSKVGGKMRLMSSYSMPHPLGHPEILLHPSSFFFFFFEGII